jgi:methylthioribose-1-phosphate isomerase
MRTVWWEDGAVKLIDQLRLPQEVVVVDCRSVGQVAEAIRSMQLRGAPAIGVAAAFGLALAAQESEQSDCEVLLEELRSAAAELRATRPTAVNLAWGLDRMLRRAEDAASRGDAIAMRTELLAEAQNMADADVAANRAMGRHGADLIPDGANVLTHCNAGALATVDWGTALGVIRSAHEAGKRLHVWVDETRPYLQGARLTAWELQQLAIPCTLITDNMAAHFMQQGKVDLVILGADRVAANGDFANKIGTYGLAVLAQAHGIPFYSAAPTSTVDMSIPDGSHIPIEERSADEVTHLRGVRIAPEGVKAAHPAFDVTPHRYLTALITEKGIVRPPFAEGLRAIMEVPAR